MFTYIIIKSAAFSKDGTLADSSKVLGTVNSIEEAENIIAGALDADTFGRQAFDYEICPYQIVD